MKKLLLSAIISSATAVMAMGGLAHAAGSANFSLSPASGNHVQNTNFSVQVLENGTNVNVVTAKLTYDASKLTCNGVSGSSAFPNTISATCGGGNVTISNYSNPGTSQSGSKVVGTISFKALASSGSTAVNFASGSQIASGGSNIWNGSTAGGNYTFSAPATGTPPVTGGGQGGSTSGSGSSSSHSTSNGSVAQTSGGTHQSSNSSSDGKVEGNSVGGSTDSNSAAGNSNGSSTTGANSSTKPSNGSHMARTITLVVLGLAAIGTLAYMLSETVRNGFDSLANSTKSTYKRVLAKAGR